VTEFLQYAILALAAARITLLLTHDDITAGLRDAMFWISPPKNEPRIGHYYQNARRIGFFKYERVDFAARKPGFWGQVLSCADCSGVWVSGAVVLGYVLLGPTFAYSLAPLSAAMIVSLLARRY